MIKVNIVGIFSQNTRETLQENLVLFMCLLCFILNARRYYYNAPIALHDSTARAAKTIKQRRSCKVYCYVCGLLARNYIIVFIVLSPTMAGRTGCTLRWHSPPFHTDFIDFIQFGLYLFLHQSAKLVWKYEADSK